MREALLTQKRSEFRAAEGVSGRLPLGAQAGRFHLVAT